MLKAALMALFIFCSSMSLAKEKILITINQYAHHKALILARQGLEDVLNNRSILDKIEIKFANAQGNIANAVQIAQYHASLSPDFMIAIATPSAQANMRVKPDSSILGFLAVTDPASAGLIGDKVIGISDMPDITRLVEISLAFFPNKKLKIGVISNAGEPSSVATVSKLKAISSAKNVVIIDVSINSISDIKIAANNVLSQKIDLLYIPKDNLVVSAIDSVMQIFNNARIPVIASDTALIEHGLLFAYGTDYFESGRILGNMMVDIIESKSIKEKIKYDAVSELRINHSVAESLSISVPKELE